jgi:hypothetical protein
MHPDFVAEFIREFHAEINRQRRDAELSLGLKRREFEETCRRLDGLIEAIADGFRAPRRQAKLDELEQSKAKLQSQIDGAPTPSTRLHPNLAELYRKKVASLQDALVDPATKTEALEILRGLIDRVSVTAGENGFTIELVGEIANMVRLSASAESLGRHFYFRAKIEETLGDEVDLRRVGAAYMRAVRVAEKVARYRHAQLSAIKLAGDINAKNYDDATLDELLVSIKSKLVKLGPLIDLDAIREAQGVENRLPVTGNTGNGTEPEAISPLRRRPPGS